IITVRQSPRLSKGCSCAGVRSPCFFRGNPPSRCTVNDSPSTVRSSTATGSRPTAVSYENILIFPFAAERPDVNVALAFDDSLGLVDLQELHGPLRRLFPVAHRQYLAGSRLAVEHVVESRVAVDLAVVNVD